MPVVGMVLVLEDPAAGTRQAVAAALAGDADLLLGEPERHRWPAVLDARDQHDAEARIEHIRDVPGIAHVDVVYADFEDMLERRVSEEARKES